jgi:hypothetical protein
MTKFPFVIAVVSRQSPHPRQSLTRTSTTAETCIGYATLSIHSLAPLNRRHCRAAKA